MKSNLIQLDSISQIFQSITPCDSSSNATSAADHASHDESPRDPHFFFGSESVSKLKIDMEYVSKELKQTRRDIKKVRTEVRI